MSIVPPEPAATLPPEETLAFLPLHKRALGMAVGTASGLTVFAATAMYLLRQPVEPAFRLDLLAEYFYGYTVSWSGAFVGLAWGFVVGFAAGWFTAFTRNLILAALIFIGRTRAELSQTRDFLDHI
jgi:hypothetical protein